MAAAGRGSAHGGRTGSVLSLLVFVLLFLLLLAGAVSAVREEVEEVEELEAVGTQQAAEAERVADINVDVDAIDDAVVDQKRALSRRRPPPPRVTVAPLIGILTQPMPGDEKELTYIAASYVKFVEAAGGRAVPIFFSAPEWDIKRRFDAVNAIIFPGGDAALEHDSPFYKTGRKLFKLAQAANDRGDYFPIHGTCLGFELLMTIVSNKSVDDLFSRFRAEDDPAPLVFLPESVDCTFLSHLPRDLLEKISGQALAMENHESGISITKFANDPNLRQFFQALTVSRDLDDKWYVSSVEAYDYPFTGTQWHPEKNAFEFGLEHIPHGVEAVKLTQAIANYIICEAKRNKHAPRNHTELLDLVIYNYPIEFSARKGSSLWQRYWFNHTEKPWEFRGHDQQEMDDAPRKDASEIYRKHVQQVNSAVV
eukprot:jgi/Chlat1/1824/Chrsp138S02143